MRRKIALLVSSIVVIVSLVFIGCAPQAPAGPTPEKPARPTPEKPIELVFSTMFPLSYKYIVNPSFDWCHKVEKRTNGRVKFTIYHSKQLYGGKEEFAAVGRGDIDVGIPHDIYHTGEVPELGITSLPFLFKSVDEANRILDAGLADMIIPIVEKANNCVVLGWTVFDPYQFYAKKPILSPKDVKGMVLGVSGTTHCKAIEAMGGSPTMMSSSELYLALQTGTIDGCTRPLLTGIGRKLYEVVNHLTIANFSPWGDILIINRDTWNSLPADIQEIMRQAADEWKEEARQLSKEFVETAIEEFKAKGVTVHILTPEELAPFREAMAPTYDWWKGKVPGAQKYLDFVEAHR